MGAQFASDPPSGPREFLRGMDGRGIGGQNSAREQQPVDQPGHCNGGDHHGELRRGATEQRIERKSKYREIEQHDAEERQSRVHEYKLHQHLPEMS